VLGTKHVFVVHPAPSSWSFLKGKFEMKVALEKQESKILPDYHPKLKLQVSEKKQRKESVMRKEGIHDLTIQSSVLQVCDKKTVKGKGDEKSIEK